MPLRIRYNAPVVLTFSLLATFVTLLAWLFGADRVLPYFSAPGRGDWDNPVFYFRLASHVLGHAGWEHLAANVAIVLLIGPLLEEKYESSELMEMIAITAVVTSVLNLVLFNSGVLGASGVVFMMILLGSMASLRRGEVPLTFLLVAILFLGREVVAAFRKDDVSQFAHLAGAACGAAFGFTRRK